MSTIVRSFRTKDVERMAEEANLTAAVYRELLAEISDRYRLGSRRDTAKGPGTGMREWSQAEAEALLSIVVLRDRGFSFDQIDRLLTDGHETVIAPTVELLIESRQKISLAGAAAA